MEISTVLGISGLAIAVSSWTVFERTKKTKTVLLVIAFALIVLAILVQVILPTN